LSGADNHETASQLTSASTSTTNKPTTTVCYLEGIPSCGGPPPKSDSSRTELTRRLTRVRSPLTGLGRADSHRGSVQGPGTDFRQVRGEPGGCRRGLPAPVADGLAVGVGTKRLSADPWHRAEALTERPCEVDRARGGQPKCRVLTASSTPTTALVGRDVRSRPRCLSSPDVTTDAITCAASSARSA
jgi:hypothetical protein